MYVRFQTGGGAETLSLGSASSNTGELFGNAIAVPLGNRPFYPGTKPPYRPKEQCYRQTPPNLNGPAAAKSAPTGQARAGGQEGAAAAAREAAPVRAHEGRRASDRRSASTGATSRRSSSCSSSRCRRRCSSWTSSGCRCRPACRCSGATSSTSRPSSRRPRPSRRARARRSTSRASRSARSRASKLESGKAVIGLKIEREHATIYRDASILMRPKTGLKDMVAELTPGTPEAGELAEGERIPASQTLPDVNLDEILASLDADTRDYLQAAARRRLDRPEGQRPRAGADHPALRADRPLRPPGQRAARRCGGTTCGARSTTSRC